MKSRPVEHEHIRRYLLGAMENTEQEQLEERLLTDADLQEELSVAENEIVYDYLTGALSDRERERFDRDFIGTPERRQKLRFFDTLIKSIDNLPKPLSDKHLPHRWQRFLPNFSRWKNPFLKLSFAAGVIVLLLGAGWIIVQNRSGRSAGSTPYQPAVYTVTLSSGQLRDINETQTVRVSVPPDAKEVKFLLPLTAGDYTSYRAVLTVSGGLEKYKTDKLEVERAANARNAYLIVPSSIITSGDYRLTLYGLVPEGGFEEIDDYNFRVVR
jgi:hypothetical protein